jgi:hypothetical protein
VVLSTESGMFRIVTDETEVHDEYTAFVSLSERIITLNKP